MSSSPFIITDQDGRVGRIVLNRGHMLNPLGPQMIAACLQALEEFEQAGMCVVEITGAGRAFCAGADLDWIRESLGESNTTPDERYDNMYRGLGYAQDLIRKLRAYPGVVVTAVNGPAVGGGVGLALCADFTVAARSAYFGMPFVPNLGLAPDLGAIAFLQQRIGSARTLGLSVLGGRLSAEDAAQAGAIWACCDDEQLPATVAELTQGIAALPRQAVLAVKSLVREAEGRSLDDYLEQERIAQAGLFPQDETLERITALLRQHTNG